MNEGIHVYSGTGNLRSIAEGEAAEAFSLPWLSQIPFSGFKRKSIRATRWNLEES